MRLALFGLVLALATPLSAQPSAEAVLEVLTALRVNSRGDQVSCANCHKPGSADGSDLFEDIRDLADLKAKGLIRAGDAENSRLYQALVRPGRRYMPLGAERLSARELKVIHDWIAAGAPLEREAVGASDRAADFVRDEDVVTWVQEDLARQKPADRPNLRYFSSVHLHNAGLEKELSATQQALTKLLNSLSWQPGIVIPERVDQRGLLLRVNIEQLGWTRARWEMVAAMSPYRTVRALPPELGTAAAVVRADWFVFQASRPPLYFSLLDLPDSESGLENLFKLDTRADVAKQKAARLGVSLSEVAIDKNRVLERHAVETGAYWKSFDFASSGGSQNVLEHPLDFHRSGGEIIFNLPNGLQGYFIVNSAGQRLDEAPVDIVQDPARRRGRFSVVTGISCMRCHANGIRRRVDEVRDHVQRNAAAFTEAEQTTIRALYPTRDVMEGLFQQDENRFAGALRQFGAENAPEPISILAKRYEDPLPLSLVAAELGLTTENFRKALLGDTVLSREYGVLASGGTVDRARFVSDYANIETRATHPSTLPAADRGKALYRWFPSARNTTFIQVPRFSGRVPFLSQIYFVKSMAAIAPAVLRDSTIVLPACEQRCLVWLKDGKELRRLDLDDVVLGLIPTADDGVIVNTRGGDVLWAKNGQLTARATLHLELGLQGALLYDGTVIEVGRHGEVLWLRDGKEVHRAQIGNESYSRISVLGGDVVLVGDSQNTYWLKDGEELGRVKTPTMQTVVLPTGNPVLIDDRLDWLNPAHAVTASLDLQRNLLLQNPTVLPDGTLFFTPIGGKGLYWAKDGTITFKNDLARVNERGSAAYADGTVVVSSDDGYVYWMKDGKKLFESGLGEVMEAEPVILPDGSVVVGCHDNHIYWIR